MTNEERRRAQLMEMPETDIAAMAEALGVYEHNQTHEERVNAIVEAEPRIEHEEHPWGK